MPSSTDTAYLVRAEVPEMIERGASNTLRCRVYSGGALSAPTSGTVSVYDGSGVALVDAQAVTVASSVATYSYAPAASLSLSDRWRVEWSLLMGDGMTHVFRTDAYLVRRRLYCPITGPDLYRMVPALDPSGDAPIDTRAHHDDAIAEAWVQVQLRLIEAGRRPQLVVGASSLRECTAEKALELIFADLEARQGIRDAESRAAYHGGRFESAWQRVRLQYDEDEDGRQDGVRSMQPTTWLGSGAVWRR